MELLILEYLHIAMPETVNRLVVGKYAQQRRAGSAGNFDVRNWHTNNGKNTRSQRRLIDKTYLLHKPLTYCCIRRYIIYYAGLQGLHFPR